MKLALLFAGLLAASVAVRPAMAEERRVVVLIPRRLPVNPWPEGTQAVIAELAAGNYQVLVESSSATSLEALSRELADELSTPNAAGAVAIVRRGSTGVAYVRTRQDDQLVELEAHVAEGAVGQGALALQVAELLRTRDLPIPEPPPKPEPPPERPLPKPIPPQAPEAKSALVWLGAGLIFTSDSDTPLTSLDLGAKIPLSGVLSAEPGVALSIVPLHLDTDPGRVNLSARQVTAHLAVEILSKRSVSFALGAGGGFAWLEESAEPRPGFRGSSDSVTVGIVSGRARGAIHAGSLSFVLLLEPGAMLPPVTIRQDGEEVAELGRPWVRISTGIGWKL